MGIVRSVAPFVVMLILSGCFQVDTVIRVNRDGSGTVVESMMLSRKMLTQMNAMMEGFTGDEGAKPKPIDLFEPEKLKARAMEMGDGVTFLSAQETESADYTGYTATYGFTDINRLRLSRDGDESPGQPGIGSAPSLPVVFHFKRGTTSTLTIDQSRGRVAESKQEKSPPDSDQTGPGNGPAVDREAKELAEMLMGMRMALVLEVNGAIVQTNATHRVGNRITIIDLDLAKFGSSMPKLEKLQGLKDGSLGDLKEALRDMPGMKVDLNDRLMVEFN